MALILMAHELHGRMHAYSAAEVEALKKQGWFLYTPPPEFADTEPVDAEAGPTLASVRAQLDELGIAYDKRYGLSKLQSLLPKA